MAAAAVKPQSIDVCDRHRQLTERIRRARECVNCGENRTVILWGRYQYPGKRGCCAPCLSDLLCILTNRTHRRKR
jgi:hypothetical protein